MATTALQAVAAVAVLVLAQPAHAQLAAAARPTGGQVVAGQASIAQTTNTTTVKQTSQNAAVNWQSYNVGSAQTVQYIDPSSKSVTLNRVVGPDPSEIAGRIVSNGTVIIVNQAGLLFDGSAQINTAGLVVSAAGISNSNLMAGKLIFDQAANPGAAIVNHGTITIKDQGLAALVAPQVVNSGVIRANLGKVILAGAETETLDLYGDGMVSINVTKQVATAPDGSSALVTNSGVISASGGTVLLTAQAVDGVVQTLVDAGGKISADSVGARTGRVVITGAGGDVIVTGAVSANGRAPGTTGGSVVVNTTGAVTVASTAKISASGPAGGGVVAIGTTLKRAKGGPSVVSAHTAAKVTVAQGATIAANATAKGKGGRVTVLSTTSTDMAGTISATGGPLGGNGGFVEVSGNQGYALTGLIDVSAPRGTIGTILLDPINLDINQGAAGSGDQDTALVTGTGTLAARAADTTNDTVSNGEIQQLGSTGNVVLQTSTGTIGVHATIDVTNALSLEAGTDLLIDKGVTIAAGGGLFLSSGTSAGTGSILLGTTTGTLGSGPVLLSAPTVVMQAGSASAGDFGIDLTNAVINSGPGAATTVDLSAASGGINQTSAGAINTGTLLSSLGVGGTVSLAGTANAVGAIGNFAVTGGDFTLVDNGNSGILTVSGPVTAGNVTISDAGTGLINVTGSLGATTALTLASGSGGIALNTGAIVSGATVDVSAAGGGISQVATGTITAGVVLQSSAGVTGSVDLAGTANAIASAGPFVVSNGGFSLTDSVALNVGHVSALTATITAPTLTVSGLVVAPTTSLTATTGALGLTGTVDATTAAILAGHSGIIGSTGMVVGGGALTATSSNGSVDLTNASNAVASVTGSGSGFSLTDSVALNVGTVSAGTQATITAPTLTVLGPVVAPTTSLTATTGLLTISGTVDATVAAVLAGHTGIIESTGMVVGDGALTATSSNGSVDLTNASNAVASVGGSGSSFSLTDSVALNVGTVTAGTQATIIAPTLTVSGLVVAPTTSLTATTGTLGLTGTVDATTAAILAGNTGIIGSAGTVVGDGALTATSSNGSVDLTNASNAVASVTGSGSSFSLVDSVALNVGNVSAGTATILAPIMAVTGTVIAPVTTLTATTGTLGLTGTVDATTSAMLSGQSAIDGPNGVILGDGAVTAISSGGSVALTNASNAVASVGGSASTGFDFHSSDVLGVGTVTAGTEATITAPDLSVTGVVTAPAVTLTATTGTLAVLGTVLAVTLASLTAQTDLTNSGTVTVSGAGGVATLAAATGTLTQSGTVQATGTAGTVTEIATLGDFTHSGLTSAGSGGVTLAATAALFTQTGGTITAANGTVAITAGTSILQSGGTIQTTGTTATGILLVSNGTGANGITQNAGALIHASDTLGTVSLLSAGTVALAGTIKALDTVAGTIAIAANGGTLYSSGTVIAGAAATLTAQTNLDNSGTITVLNGAATLVATTGTLGQTGTVIATTGGTLIAQTDLTNTGSVLISAGPATLVATGGDLGQGGLVMGTSVFESAGGALTHSGVSEATATSATLIAHGTTLYQSGTVSAVTLASLTAQTDLTNSGTVTVSGASGAATLTATTGTLTQSGTVQTTGTAGAVTETAILGDLTHSGLTSAGSGGVTLAATAALFTQTGGTITAANGTVAITAGTSILQSGGTIETTGTVPTAILLVSNGTGANGITQNAGALIHASDTLGTVSLLSAGTVALAGTIKALDTVAGTIGIAANGGTLYNSGTVIAGAAGTLTALTDLTNDGTVGVNFGPAVLTAGHDLFQNGQVYGGTVFEGAGHALTQSSTGTSSAGNWATLIATGTTLTNSGIVVAGTLASLSAATILDNIGTVIAGTLATSGSVLLNGSLGVELPSGLIDAANSGTVSLASAAGGVTQASAGTIITGTLVSSGTIGNAVSLLGTANAIGTIGPLMGTGDIQILDTSALTIATGSVVRSTTGNIYIESSNTAGITFGAGGTVATLGTLQTVGLQTDALTNLGTTGATGSVSTNSGTFELAPNTSGSLVSLGTTGGLSLVSLTGITAERVRIGAVTEPVSGFSTTAGSITVGGTGFAAGTTRVLELDAMGDVGQTAPLINVGTLTGTAGSFTLTDIQNTITTIGLPAAGTLGSLGATGPVVIDDATNLTIAGDVLAGPAGASVSVLNGNTLTVNGEAASPAGSVWLNAGSIVLAQVGTVLPVVAGGTAGAVTLTAASLTQNAGVINAGAVTLNAGTAGAVTLTNGLIVATAGTIAFTAATVSVNSGETIAAANTATGVSFTADVTQAGSSYIGSNGSVIVGNLLTENGGTLLAAGNVTLGALAQNSGVINAGSAISVGTGTGVAGWAGSSASGGSFSQTGGSLASVGATNIFTTGTFSQTAGVVAAGGTLGVTANTGISIAGTVSAYEASSGFMLLTNAGNANLTATGLVAGPVLSVTGDIIPGNALQAPAGTVSITGTIGSKAGAVTGPVAQTGTYALIDAAGTLGVVTSIAPFAQTLTPGSVASPTTGGTLVPVVLIGGTVDIESLVAATTLGLYAESAVVEGASGSLDVTTLTGSAGVLRSGTLAPGLTRLGWTNAGTIGWVTSTVDTVGSVALTGTSNVIGTLSDFAVTGNFALAETGPMTQIGTLQAGSALSDSNTGTLATTTISVTGALTVDGVIATGIDDGQTRPAGNTMLSATGSIATSGTIAAVPSGSSGGLVSVTATTTLSQTAGVINGGTVTLTAPGGATLSGGTIVATKGTIGIVAPSATVSAGEIIAALNSATGVYFSENVDQAASSYIGSNGSVVVTGLLTENGGTLLAVGDVTLGALLQNSGTIAAGSSLFIGSGTGVAGWNGSTATSGTFDQTGGLLAAANDANIFTTGTFAQGGGAMLATGGTLGVTANHGIDIAGTVSAAGTASGFALLTNAGSAVLETSGLLAGAALIVPGDTIGGNSLQAPAALAGTVTIAGTVGTQGFGLAGGVGSIAGVSGYTITPPANPAIVPTLLTPVVGTPSLTPTPAMLSGNAIDIERPVTASTLGLYATTMITEGSLAVIDAIRLTGSSGADVSFPALMNNIGTLGAFDDTGNAFSLVDASNLMLTGKLTANSVQITDTNYSIDLTGSILANSVLIVGSPIDLTGSISASSVVIQGSTIDWAGSISANSVVIQGSTIDLTTGAAYAGPGTASGNPVKTFPSAGSDGVYLQASNITVLANPVVATGGSDMNWTFALTGNGNVALSNPQQSNVSFDQPTVKLFLALASGTATGQVDVAGLQVSYTTATTKTIDLTGIVRSVPGALAAAASQIAPLPKNNYQINGCPISSVNCIKFTGLTVPVTNPLQDVALDWMQFIYDADSVLPDVAERDY
jgi:filamentous hemagglutinin family protein